MTRPIVFYPLLAILEKPGVRIEDIPHPITSHVDILIIDVDPIRQKRILFHPSFKLTSTWGSHLHVSFILLSTVFFTRLLVRIYAQRDCEGQVLKY